MCAFCSGHCSISYLLRTLIIDLPLIRSKLSLVVEGVSLKEDT